MILCKNTREIQHKTWVFLSNGLANLSFLLLGDCLVIGKKVVENAVMNVSLGWNYGQYKRNMQAFRPELYTLKRVLHLKNYNQNLERMVFNFFSKVVFKVMGR